jgi:MFS family permease
MSQSVFQLVGQVKNNDQLLVGRFNGTQVGLVLAIFSIIFASGTVAWGFLIGRITKIKIMFVSLLGAYLCCFALIVLNHTFLHPNGSSNWLFVIFLVLLGGGVFAQSGFTPTALAFIGDLSEGHESDRGTIIGFYYLFLSVGQMLGAWFGGIFAQFLQIDGVIILTIVLVTTGILNLFFISRRQMELNHAATK